MGRGSSRRGYRWITDDVGLAWLGKPERSVRISRAFLFGDRESARICSGPLALGEFLIFFGSKQRASA